MNPRIPIQSSNRTNPQKPKKDVGDGYKETENHKIPFGVTKTLFRTAGTQLVARDARTGRWISLARARRHKSTSIIHRIRR
jgi:hypothetical protein